MEKRILTAVAVMALVAGSVYAGGVGTTGAQFLKIGPSARALGMGGAYGAISDDVYGLYFNPSGIANAENTEISATYISYFADISYAYAGFVKPNTKMGAIGLAITNVGVGNIEKRAGDTAAADGTFGASDMAITLAWAKKTKMANKDSSLGASLKIISSKIDTQSASAFAIDLAATHKVSEKLNTALVIQNIGGGIKYVNDSDSLPLNLKLAGALKVNDKVTAALDLDQGLADGKLYASLGAEWWIVKQFALRGGYKYGYSSTLGGTTGLGVGIGFRMWECGLDYAFVPFGDLGDTHRVSLLYRFGK